MPDNKTTKRQSVGGGDIELGNFIQGGPCGGNTCSAAARAILDEIEGFPGDHDPDRSHDAGEDLNPRDWCRKFLAANGGCIYIDLGHVEVCLPEVTNARDFVAYYHAMLRTARRAQVAANAKLPDGERIHVLVNNSDGRGHSYGAHLNFLIDRRTFDDIAWRRVHLQLYLASYQVSSIVFAGMGKIGSENGRPPADFQISQRADFFEVMSGVQTTVCRPLINLRNEPLCGPGDGELARLHSIFYDANLCHVAAFLKFGVMQVVLSSIGAGRIDPGLILEDPLEAVLAWSHDPGLRAQAVTLDGSRCTAVEHQLRFAEAAQRFVETGDCAVPEAANIIALWQDTLDKLRARDWTALQPRLDWVLKLASLKRAMQEHTDLDWDSGGIRCLDHLYSSLDPQEGLYWHYDRAGLVERLVDDDAIDRATREPPCDTRAWTRAMLLRRAHPATVDAVDWDLMRFCTRTARGWHSRTLRMDDPVGLTEADCGDTLAAATLDETLDRLGVP